MHYPKPLFLAPLLFELDQALLHYLEELSAADWEAQTTAPQWKVKDVAAHLLDGNLRTLSMLRDGYYGEAGPDEQSYGGLVSYLNRLNHDWVAAMRRLSPRLLIDWLEESGVAYCEYLRRLDNFAPAAFSVAWAGEQESQNWFHVAREYTEKWHHQQQIRHATGDPDTLLQDHWYIPYLDTSLRALPHHYRDISGEAGDMLRIVFRGENDKVWYLHWQEGSWQLLTDTDDEPVAEVILPDAIAWRVFTKGISREEALSAATMIGKEALTTHLFSMIAVMA